MSASRTAPSFRAAHASVSNSQRAAVQRSSNSPRSVMHNNPRHSSDVPRARERPEPAVHRSPVASATPPSASTHKHPAPSQVLWHAHPGRLRRVHEISEHANPRRSLALRPYLPCSPPARAALPARATCNTPSARRPPASNSKPYLRALDDRRPAACDVSQQHAARRYWQKRPRPRRYTPYRQSHKRVSARPVSFSARTNPDSDGDGLPGPRRRRR